MRKQRRIAASLAAVLLSTGITITDATAAPSASDAGEFVGPSLYNVPAYSLRSFRFDESESYITPPAPPPAAPEARPAPRVRPQRASRARVVAAGASGGAFARLRKCESGGNYAANTGNGYYGAYQFSLSTWRSLGYGGYPHQASPATQDAAARRLQARSGWGQWPACARKLGLR